MLELISKVRRVHRGNLKLGQDKYILTSFCMLQQIIDRMMNVSD